MVKDYTELARLGQVTRARITQIMKLLNLAPKIQEQILLLPPVIIGRDRVSDRQLRDLSQTLNWSSQIHGWENLVD